MPDGRRDDVALVLEIVVVFLKLSECLADVTGHGRFLRDDQGLAHMVRSSLRFGTPSAQLIFSARRKIEPPTDADWGRKIERKLPFPLSRFFHFGIFP